MLPKSLRLTTTKDIERVIKQKQYTFNSPSFNLYARRNDLPVSRLAVSASKKIGNAVIRNRLRRKFKAEFYKNREMLGMSVDMVVFPRKACVACDNAMFGSEVLGALAHLRRLNGLDPS